MSRVGNLVSIFASPGVVARRIAEDPHWLLPLIIVLAVVFVVSVLTHEYQLEYQRPAVEKLMRDAGRDEDEIAARFESTPRGKVIGGAGAMAFTVVFLMLVPAAILNGISTITGEKVGFRKMFSLMTSASVILALGQIVRLPLVLAKGSINVRTSVAAFTPSVAIESPLGTLLNSLDVFSIWMLVAVCVGFATLAGINIKKSSMIVVALWAAGIAVLVGFAVLRSNIMPGA
jgi:hypothetical protein